MGIIRSPLRVKVITALLACDTELLRNIKKDLESAFWNRVDFESDLLDFTHTDYYNEELGEGLKRKFLSFSKLLDPGKVAELKLKSNVIEKKYSRDGKRRINIDPGYIDLSKLVLLSTKDYSHRIYLGRGIYAETTLVFKGKRFEPWPWTYPDYRSDEYIEIFNKIRFGYKDTLTL